MTAAQPHVVRPSDRTLASGPGTPGMVREVAFATDELWIGHVRTEPGVRSGWHHHGEMDTYFYVVQGAIEIEHGAGGRQQLSARAGDFAHIPRASVHREGTSAEQPGEAIVIRIGGGQPVINVDGPDAG
jgi:uncharacterized RmlC-like cupin family protein